MQQYYCCSTYRSPAPRDANSRFRPVYRHTIHMVTKHVPKHVGLAVAAGPTGILRPYQASVIDRAVELYGQGTRRLLVPLATGLGKTVVFTHLPQVNEFRILHTDSLFYHMPPAVVVALAGVSRAECASQRLNFCLLFIRCCVSILL